jgi:hypothetical protein
MNNQQLMYMLGGLLALSVLGNVYALYGDKPDVPSAVVQSCATSTFTVVDSPYGYRSEVVTLYDNGQVRTYATTTPMTERDVEQIIKRAEARFRAMDVYFRKQEEFFRDFWDAF